MSSPRAVACIALALCLLAASAAPPARAGEEGGGRVAMERAARHAVVVAFRFQRDLEMEERGAVPPDPQGLAERYRFWRYAWWTPGFVIGDRRTVLVSDPWLSPSAIESVTVRTRDGTEVEGRLDAFLAGVGGVIVRTEADLPVEPLRAADAAGTTPRWAASVAEGPGEVEAWVEDLGARRFRTWSDPAGPVGFGRRDVPFGGLDQRDDGGARSVDLVCDDAGLPLGFRFGGPLPDSDRWRLPAVLADRRIPFDDLHGLEERWPSPLHRLTVTFRTQSRHDRDRSPFAFANRGTTEEEYWGVAVTPHMLVVPLDLDEEKVRSVISIRLDDVESDEPPEVAYAGKLEGYEAFLVGVKGVELDALPDEAPAVPDVEGALLEHRVAQRGGTRRDQIDYNRVLGRARGYGDRRYLVTEREIQAGVFLLDLDGRMVGFSAKLDPVDQERRLGDGRRPGSNTSRFPVVALLFEEEGLPATLLDRADTRVMPQEETEARRLPWLGVEYDGLDEGLAELLGISEPTRDGRRGLIVTVVYPDSPAAAAGLRLGDVLLSARRTSAPGGPPIDLRDAGDGGGFYFPGMFGGSGPAPWHGRETTLVRLLKDWGTGTTYELVWLRDGGERRRTLTVEQAPPDFRSAPRDFDEGAGLEVRDLTYEVRHVLRLAPDAQGVVVARIEPGSGAAQARIVDNELVREVDGRPVPSAEAFRETIEAAREAGRTQVRLVVEHLGKTRIVDLKITGEPRDAEEEGGEEEGAE